ncbi:MAG: hypothetical protein KTR31_22140 [Myxococcales bacterium]|nr:hypothetical protein [Myxococcales bacterium]
MSRMLGRSASTVLWVWALAACSGGTTGTDRTDQTTDDVDTSDTSDTDTPPTQVDPDAVLVVPTGSGLALLELDGSIALSRTWTELVGNCGNCGGEGASDDGDGLLVSFTNGGPNREGAIARLDTDFELDFRLDGFAFPHDVERDPADGTLIVEETSADRLAWLPADGSSATPDRTLDTSNADFAGNPNGLDRFDHDGRSYALVTHRGGGGGNPGGVAGGSITLWDITTAGSPEFQWRFPATGAIDTPHGAMLRQWQDQWWLLWAHTEGAPNGGSVGLAVADAPTDAPAYVADLVPEDDVGPFNFLRGVELSADGRLFATDSGRGGGGNATGQVVEAVMPDLAPTGAVGNVDDQVLVSLGPATALASDLPSPYEAWLWVRSTSR